MLYIKLLNTKTKIQRNFTVSNNDEIGVDLMELYRKYVALRPKNINSRRFFIRYCNGICFNQVVGMNVIGKIPNNIADFLKLPNSIEYTGHCFRRSSASLLANAGGDILTLKRHGGWKSSSVAETYIDDSINNKLSIGEKIFNSNKRNQTKTVTRLPSPANTSATFTSSSGFEVEYINNEGANEATGNYEATGNQISEVSAMIQSLPSGSGINIQNCSNCTINIKYA